MMDNSSSKAAKNAASAGVLSPWIKASREATLVIRSRACSAGRRSEASSPTYDSAQYIFAGLAEESFLHANAHI